MLTGHRHRERTVGRETVGGREVRRCAAFLIGSCRVAVAQNCPRQPPAAHRAFVAVEATLLQVRPSSPPRIITLAHDHLELRPRSLLLLPSGFHRFALTSAHLDLMGATSGGTNHITFSYVL